MSSKSVGLNEYIWYWGDVSKDVVAAAMENKRDGSFVVRDASTPGDFTLTLKINGANRLIKILVRNGRCGFTMDSLDFDHISKLIEHYRKRTLKQFNDQLNVCLIYPLLKPNRTPRCFSEMARRKKLSEEVVKCRLEGLQAEYERVTRHYDQFVEQHAALIGVVHEKRAAIEAYASARVLFQRNVDMLKSSMDGQSDDNRIALHNNSELQKRRVSDIARAEMLMVNSLKNVEQTIACMAEEIADTQPRLAALRMQREECRDILTQRDAPQVERFLKEINYILEVEAPKLSAYLLHQVPPHWVWEPQWWLIADPSKEVSNCHISVALSNAAAERPANGIFLIRPSLSRIGFFVLVITMNEVIHSCLVEYRDSSRSGNCGYGFHNTDMFFTTLIDFVRYYSQVNLREHNAQLDTTLHCPVLYVDGLCAI